MIESALRWVAALARRRYWRLFIAAALLTLVALASASRLRFDTRILSLLPADDPVVRTFRTTVEEFGSTDLLLVLVRMPADQPGEPYFDFIDALGQRLEELPELEYVDYELGDLTQLVEESLPRALLFLDDEGRREVEERLSDEGIENRVQLIRRRAATLLPLELRRVLQIDPLGISEVLLQRMATPPGAVKADWTRGYFLSPDNRLALMLAKPIRPALEAEFDRRLLASVASAVDETRMEWRETAAAESSPAPDVELGGPYVTVLEDAGNMASDMAVNLLTALAGVLVLFAIAFRRVSLVGYALLPLGFGLVLGFGFAGATFGTLSVASTGFAALLVGLGIDFVIVSYGRYVEERGRGADLERALVAMGGSSGRAVVTGAVTTAATFFAFAVTDFSGLRQMGLLTGSGILFCMISILVLLPALLAWSDDRRVRIDRVRKLHIHGFGAGRLAELSFRRPKQVLLAAGLLTLAAAALAPRLGFEDDIRKLRPEGSRGVAIENEVAEAFGRRLDYMMLLLSGASEDETLVLAHRAEERARELVTAGVVGGYEGIGALVPDPQRQAAGVAWLEKNAELFDEQRLRRVFTAAAEREGIRATAFYGGLRLLAESAKPRGSTTFEGLGADARGERLLRRFARRNGDGMRAVLYLHPPPGGWGRSVPPEVYALAADLGPGAVLSGANLIGERLRDKVRVDAWIASIVGLAVVALLLWLDYRRVWDTLLSLLPLGVGILWMFGCMVVLGLEMNFFNIFVATMIIGIGVDYGVHIVHRYRESRRHSRAGFVRAVCETSRAIALAALSTCVGFGSLSLSHYPGLRSMGWVAMLGACATALVAITVLPALLALQQRDDER